MIRKYKATIYNLSTYFGAAIIPTLLNLGINPWIAKNMSPEDYAITGYYTSFSSLVSPLIIFYLVHYYLKEYFRCDEETRKQLYSSIAKATIWFSGLLSILCFVVLFFYISLIHNSLPFSISPYLQLMVFAIPFSGLLSLELARCRMGKESKKYFFLSVGSGVVTSCITLLFVVFIKWGAFGKLFSTLIANFLIFVFMLIRNRDIIFISITKIEFRKIFTFCLPLTISAMFSYFLVGYPTTFLEHIRQTTEYGIFVVGASIGTYLTVFQTAISNTFQPDIYESTIKKDWKVFIKYALLQIFLIVSVVIAYIFLAPYVINILTAGRYVASTGYSQIVSISCLSSCLYYLVNNYTIATNRPHLILLSSIFGSIIVIILMPVLTKSFNFYGGAWMRVLSFIIFALINILLLMGTKVEVLISKIMNK